MTQASSFELSNYPTHVIKIVICIDANIMSTYASAEVNFLYTSKNDPSDPSCAWVHADFKLEIFWRVWYI